MEEEIRAKKSGDWRHMDELGFPDPASPKELNPKPEWDKLRSNHTYTVKLPTKTLSNKQHWLPLEGRMKMVLKIGKLFERLFKKQLDP